MKKNSPQTYFCLVVLFLLSFLFIEGQTNTKKKSPTKSKQSELRKSQEKKLKEEILAQIKKELEKNKPSNFYVFVGEKVEVKPFQPEVEKDVILRDSAFKAKYRIIQNVYGDYQKDTIEFEVYDHYGAPPFAKYKTALLFVSEHKGKLYHEKYQYFDVYKTTDGRWASCGDPYKFDDVHRKDIKAVKLQFVEPLIFNLNGYKDKYIRAIFTKPYFRIEGNKAECLMGSFVDKLFSVKKEGVLKARGLF